MQDYASYCQVNPTPLQMKVSSDGTVDGIRIALEPAGITWTIRSQQWKKLHTSPIEY